MLEIVSKGFKSAKAALTGKTELTEANINEAVREIRVSLLEADVEIGVVRTFLKRVKERAIGEVVQLQTSKGIQCYVICVCFFSGIGNALFTFTVYVWHLYGIYSLFFNHFGVHRLDT